jgi:hypothetical protein
MVVRWGIILASREQPLQIELLNENQHECISVGLGWNWNGKMQGVIWPFAAAHTMEHTPLFS